MFYAENLIRKIINYDTRRPLKFHCMKNIKSWRRSTLKYPHTTLDNRLH